MCQPDERRSGLRPRHVLRAPDKDDELLRVHAWLVAQPITEVLRNAVDSAVKYVLDGARTWRFDLNDPAVDSDERATVGTKLQYHVIEMLDLTKEPPLDTVIDGLAVEIKGTVQKTWMIPREGQCEITLLIRIDIDNQKYSAWLMRTHRAWLTGKKGNRDLKRSPRAEAFRRYALEVAPWTTLPPEPLRLLTHDQLSVVFDRHLGLRRRIQALFEFLPGTVIPRASIGIVGAGLDDPLRRAREAKSELRNNGLIVLVGTWPEERRIADKLGVNLPENSWVAIPKQQFAAAAIPIPPAR